MIDATSPCIRLCVIDEKTGYCAGCGRTSEEIAAWIMMPTEARIALKAELPARLVALNAATTAERRNVALAKQA
jgi:hypothetical protein